MKNITTITRVTGRLVVVGTLDAEEENWDDAVPGE